MASTEFQAPDAVLVNRRWVKQSTCDWVQRADAILKEHGAVNGSQSYERRHQARWRAQRLMDLMVRLDLHERWELREHTTYRQDGWSWSVEYVGKGAR